jgi:hypothetical protein
MRKILAPVDASDFYSTKILKTYLSQIKFHLSTIWMQWRQLKKHENIIELADKLTNSKVCMSN